jgi:hypothetical protein
MPADAKPRWITVRQRFDYTWPSRAVTHFSDADLGEHLVKAELADFAVEKGYATEGKLDGSAKSRKSRKRVTKGKPAAKAAVTRTVATVGDESAAGADRSAGGSAVVPDAG